MGLRWLGFDFLCDLGPEDFYSMILLTVMSVILFFEIYVGRDLMNAKFFFAVADFLIENFKKYKKNISVQNMRVFKKNVFLTKIMCLYYYFNFVIFF